MFTIKEQYEADLRIDNLQITFCVLPLQVKVHQGSAQHQVNDFAPSTPILLLSVASVCVATNALHPGPETVHELCGALCFNTRLLKKIGHRQSDWKGSRVRYEPFLSLVLASKLGRPGSDLSSAREV